MHRLALSVPQATTPTLVFGGRLALGFNPVRRLDVLIGQEALAAALAQSLSLIPGGPGIRQARITVEILDDARIPERPEGLGDVPGRLNAYHFECGNSTVGTTELCATVQAQTPQEAVRTLRKALPSRITIPTPQHRVLSCTAYLDPQNITVQQIDEATPIEEAV